MALEFTVIIPARFSSARLPGKPLRDVAGKPLIQRTWEAACASAAKRVIVATDDEGIARAVENFGGVSCMTADSHISGTDRVAQAATLAGLDPDQIVVNVQGDEPDMPPALVDQVALLLHQDKVADVATACAALEHREQYFDSSVVKVVRDNRGHALYFSRSPIPYSRQESPAREESIPWSHIRRHIGIYAYRHAYLQEFASREPCPPENLERLEQLRVLWHGEKIAVAEATVSPGPGVDTLDDLERVIHLFQKQNQ
ncbi:MAG: 3-deoxy-manno-octulosonate cytidylyltransferase [Acidiferrobacteraceae bacterium]|jgi:3-deoxy-manno-octulosonate cytidylyltransferase (CMP-KDO synthetase)|nr:3-deoxy-manno-octulosonate cytidylyltransferase [Acidiferrobacteraceae bacterium]MCP4827529.1 3-deoxy-manno-octulosonate cytidylyltransferase [Pseudomonadota bacterium]|tara:strand:+ start:611 stop:1381 length:771 start_codon:yes stop_codon:yes gene_type:complete